MIRDKEYIITKYLYDMVKDGCKINGGLADSFFFGDSPLAIHKRWYEISFEHNGERYELPFLDDDGYIFKPENNSLEHIVKLAKITIKEFIDEATIALNRINDIECVDYENIEI